MSTGYSRQISSALTNTGGFTLTVARPDLALRVVLPSQVVLARRENDLLRECDP